MTFEDSNQNFDKNEKKMYSISKERIENMKTMVLFQILSTETKKLSRNHIGTSNISFKKSNIKSQI